MPQVTLKVPPSVLEAAKRAAQAFDNDVGGYASFEPTDDAGMHICTVDVSDEYAEAFPAFKAFPELLHDTIARDFAARFPDDDVPTLSDVAAFCDVVEIVVYNSAKL